MKLKLKMSFDQKYKVGHELEIIGIEKSQKFERGLGLLVAMHGQARWLSANWFEDKKEDEKEDIEEKMTYGKFVQIHIDFLKNHPEAAKFEVIYASDEEGNDYKKLCYSPTIGQHIGGDYGDDFIQSADELEEGEEIAFNAVCIN